jgi:hypothetical protein
MKVSSSKPFDSLKTREKSHLKKEAKITRVKNAAKEGVSSKAAQKIREKSYKKMK